MGKQTPNAFHRATNTTKNSTLDHKRSKMMKTAMKKSTMMSARPSASKVVCRASLQERVTKFVKGAGVGAATLALTLSANAATVKLGSDTGALVFEPSSVTISKGDSVTWVNNAGFPHNIVFDEDAIPSGVSAEALSHEDYLNAPGEKATSKFDVAGTYEYYCEPHQGAGMQGKIVVQ